MDEGWVGRREMGRSNAFRETKISGANGDGERRKSVPEKYRKHKKGERGRGGRQGCRCIGGNRRTVETFQGSAAWTISSVFEARRADVKDN